jgi:ankyrin repeat protein
VDQNPQFFDLFNILTSTPNSTRLFFPIYYGNAELFDQYVQDFDIDSNEINSALNLAIAFPNKTEMVRHILENYSADPTERLLLGRNALEMAAIHADKTEIIDLLLRQENVDIDGRDEFGRTALHFAAYSSNVVAARHLIKMGATPNLFDRHGNSPLHSAAHYSDDTEMIDLLLEAQKKSQGEYGIDTFDPRSSIEFTALHSAANASNEITAKHLIKRGADPNRKDKFGRTPIHFAASLAKDIDIIDVFLSNKQVDVNSLDIDERTVFYYAECNEHGLTEEIVDRLNAPRNPAKSRRPLIFLLVFILGFFIFDSLFTSIGLCLFLIFLFHMCKI